MVDAQTRLRPNKPEVIAELVDDQVIIINQSTDVYHRLDRVGSLIWSMFCESRSVEDIGGAIAKAFGITSERAQADVRTLAEQLLLAKIVVPSDESAAVSTPTHIPEQTQTYESPRLNLYGLSDQACLQPNEPDVAATVIDGEAIIINVLTGVYYSLDGVGAVIWSLIAAGCPNEQIVEQVAELYQVGPERVREDLEKLAGQLVTERIVRIRTGTPEPTEPPAMDKPATTYHSPELNTYADMEDLLALDPPLPTPGDMHIGDVQWTNRN